MLTNGDNHVGSMDKCDEKKRLMNGELQPIVENEGDPDEDVGSTTIFSLLPEIWDHHILPNLSPEEFHALINTLPEWREMFKTLITDKLLSLVLKVLVNHKMTEGDFLVWRAVSRSTKSVIDSVLEKGASPSAYWENLTTHNVCWTATVEERPPRRLIESLRENYKVWFDTPFKWNNWVSYIHSLGDQPSPQLNAFLMRSLQLQVGSPIRSENWENRGFDPESYLPFLNYLLSGFACRFVTSFTAEIKFWAGDTEDFGITTLLASLERLPLLKILKVMGHHTFLGTVDETVLFQEDYYPPLNHLELLDVTEYYHGPEAADEENRGLNFMLLNRYGRQLKTFICSATFFRTEANIQLLNVQNLPNLKCLGVTTPDQNVLGTLSTLDLPLEDLHLSGSVRPLVRLGVRSIFRAINNINLFAPTLVHLRLHIRAMDSDGFLKTESFSEPPVKFPKLKKISTRLVYSGAHCFWEFVEQKCDNLEQIVMHAQKRPRDSGRTETRLRRGFELVPCLQKIVLYFGYEHGEDLVPEKITLFRNGTRDYERSGNSFRYESESDEN